MITVTIDRSKWLHGEGSNNSKLLRRKDKKMCCIGFLAIECGAKEKDILNRDAIAMNNETDNDAMVSQDKLPDFNKLKGRPIEVDDILIDAYNVNDLKELSDEDRERDIKDTLKPLGVKVKFIGKY